MKPYRSLLFVPGNRQRMLEKAPTTNADAVILDLEDAVPIGEKQTARSMICEALATFTAQGAFVRINGMSSGETLDDVRAIVSPSVEGIFLPKVQSADEVRTVSAWLDEAEAASGVPHGRVEVLCMLETAGGLRSAYEIASASPRVTSLVCSSAEDGDLQTDLGSQWTPDGTAMLYARSKIVVDARAAGIAHPLDGVYARIQDLDGLVRDSEISRSLGYRGRAIIHPSHIDAVNRVYAPTPEEVAYSQDLVSAFDAAVADHRASLAFRGKMVDYAMIVRARRVLDDAATYGIEAARE